METPPENSKKSWISRHPLTVIGIILLVCLGPFVNKAVHVDDALFIWAGEWIQKHPVNFFGSEVNWFGNAIPMWEANRNPPLMSYFLAAVASVFGWNLIVLHLAGLAVAFMATAGIYSLAKMWCERPLLATVVAIFTPVFLVSSSTLMCDVLMLTFWIWAIVFWERALGSGQGRWQFVGAGALAGLAVLTKYSAVTLLPLLPLMSILRTRKLGWWLVGTAVPLIMVATYEWITAGMYGKGLLSAAAVYAQTRHFHFLSDWKARGIIGLAFAGGSLLPLLFFAPLLWHRRTLLKGGVVIFGVLLGIFWSCDNLGLAGRWAPPEFIQHWGFQFQVAFLTAGGLHLLLLAGAETWQRRDTVAVTLVLWIVSGLLFAMLLNWTVSARGFLPIVPAAAILLVRRLRTAREKLMVGGWFLWPLIPSATITLSVVAADCQWANSTRTAAEQIAAQYKSTGHKTWFEGHWGFQYYMQKLGGQPVDHKQSLLMPGDVVVVPWLFNYNIFSFKFPPSSLGWIETVQSNPNSWVRPMGGAAGFYDANWGPIPFAIGKLPRQEYFVVKVFSELQFHNYNQSATRPEASANDAPGLSNSSQPTNVPAFQVNLEMEEQVQLAFRLEAAGKLEAAIQQYRKALDVNSTNAILLNNLAWILATSDKPGLRDGKEAVQLATRAVKLTDSRQPFCIGTLGAAYAETGQFEKAIQAAKTAQVLAQLTGQDKLAAKSLELLNRYSAGGAIDAPGGP
jgi:hypothetical protein